MARWYCMISGKKCGPLSTGQLRQYAAEGRLKPDDLIIRDGLSDWVQASRAKGLFDAPNPEASRREAAQRQSGTPGSTVAPTSAEPSPADQAPPAPATGELQRDATPEQSARASRWRLLVAGTTGVVVLAAVVVGVILWPSGSDSGERPTQLAGTQVQEEQLAETNRPADAPAGTMRPVSKAAIPATASVAPEHQSFGELKTGMVTRETVAMKLPKILAEVRKDGEIFTVAPGNRHWAWQIGSEGSRFVMLDGKTRYGPYQAVGDLHFSPDGKWLAYAAKLEDHWRPVVNGKPADGPGYDEMKHVRFDESGGHVAFAAQRGSKWFVVVDGKAGRPYDKIRVGPFFGPGGAIVVYEAYKGGDTYAVVNGKEHGPYRWTKGGYAFSHDGKRIAYAAYTGKDFIVVADGKAGKPYEEARRPALSNGTRVAFAAKSGGQWFLIADGRQSGRGYRYPFGVYLSPDGRRLIHGAFDGRKFRLVINGRDGKTYDRAMFQGEAFSADGRNFACAVERGGRWLMLHDGVEGKPYDEVGSPVLSPNGKRLAYAAKERSDWAVVVDGVKGRPYAKLGSRIDGAGPTFSPDGQHIAYAAKVGDQWALVIDGVEGKRYDSLVGESVIAFDGPDSLRMMACRADQLLLVHISVTGNAR